MRQNVKGDPNIVYDVYITFLENPEAPKSEPMKEHPKPAEPEQPAEHPAGGQPQAPDQGGDAQTAGEYQKGEGANTDADKATKELDQKVKEIEGELDKALQDQQKESVNKY